MNRYKYIKSKHRELKLIGSKHVDIQVGHGFAGINKGSDELLTHGKEIGADTVDMEPDSKEFKLGLKANYYKYE